MGYFVRDYLNNEYNIPEEMLDIFEELNSIAQDYELDLADCYNAAYQMLTYFKQFKVI